MNSQEIKRTYLNGILVVFILFKYKLLKCIKSKQAQSFGLLSLVLCQKYKI